MTVKNAQRTSVGQSWQMADGHFSVSGLAAGTYTVETSGTGLCAQHPPGVSGDRKRNRNLSITLNVDAISQSVTVQESVSLAVETLRKATRSMRLPPEPRSAAP